MSSALNTMWHEQDIIALRERAQNLEESLEHVLALGLAADLLELHDATALSLDKWGSARRLVEHLIGHPIEENGA